MFLINNFKEGIDNKNPIVKIPENKDIKIPENTPIKIPENAPINIIPVIPTSVTDNKPKLTNIPELDEKIVSKFKEFNEMTKGISIDKMNENIKVNYLTSFDILFQKYESNADQYKILSTSPLVLAFNKDATNDVNLENIIKVITEYIKLTEKK
jgi:hypothetical protein